MMKIYTEFDLVNSLRMVAFSLRQGLRAFLVGVYSTESVPQARLVSYNINISICEF